MSNTVTLVDNGNITVGEHPMIKRFMKGIYNLRPSLPKYTTVWDVSLVLTQLSKSDPTEVSLKDLTLRTTVLLAILSGQRVQTLSYLSLKDMHLQDDCVQFYIGKLLKQSRPGHHLSNISFVKYDDKRLCIINHLNLYLDKTRELRASDNDALLISYQKPHASVTSETISRWIKRFLMISGVDINVFSAHSTRSSSTSAAAMAGCPIDEILRQVGWHRASTFGKFYHKETVNDNRIDMAILTAANKGKP